MAKGRNQGINMSQGEFIVLLDNNVVVSPKVGFRPCCNVITTHLMPVLSAP